MAISPQQLNENFLDEVAHLESHFDKLLARKKIAPGGRIFLSYPITMTSSHFQILKGRYLEAGWKDVTLHHDQRDGDHLIIFQY